MASILHRVSGAGLFLMLPLLIWLLQLSLGSTQDSAAMFAAVTGNWLVKLILLGLLWAFLHHFCMGIRILLIDIHVGVEKQQAHNSAMTVMVVSLALTAITRSQTPGSLLTCKDSLSGPVTASRTGWRSALPASSWRYSR